MEGCQHYICRCAYVSPCCKKIYVCRLCHDDVEQHEIDRFAVQEIVCLKCDEHQPIRRTCIKCEVVFGNYFCEICRLYDDNDKKQFHCMQCGICRIGGRENFFHCPKCDMCLSINIKDSHKCVEGVCKSNCPVCMDNLHTTREKLNVLPCGHICHERCFTNLFKSGIYACPVCCQSMCDMSHHWRVMDIEIEQVEMPNEYKDKKNWILCRDCHKECDTKFHVIGLKCLHCGSYNTCGADRPAGADAAAANATTAPTTTFTSTSTTTTPTTTTSTSITATTTTSSTTAASTATTATSNTTTATTVTTATSSTTAATTATTATSSTTAAATTATTADATDPPDTE
ncbi:hypothetical protein HELRODRAFT_68929 [Helobdella robusta]|uniref:RING finger and CHY zinc finger domain-containing protein 1 n=1 Tax=Helobdella robusta TaxID=6412 RepID=T1FZM0_HELRO|nr:hypothetical protein HELRODRAFT_68929 [Helobdella robusta]ESN94636.1 hypothetical protein HELRODRAFT_68929 [Helobdella robusta]